MTEFVYAALNEKGELVEGRVQAENKDAAIAAVQLRKCLLLSLTPAPAAAKKAPRGGKSSVALWELVFLAEQLATLLEGGLPLMRALSLQQGQARNPRLAAALGEIAKGLAGGKTLAGSLAEHPGVFPQLWPAMVRIGETTGALPKMLFQIAAYHESQEEIRSRVVSALMYPMILMILSLSVLAFFIVRIVPNFAEIFDSFGTKMPPLTAAVIYGSVYIKDHLALLVMAGIALYAVVSSIFATEGGRRALDRTTRSLPFFGDFIVAVYTQRLLSALALLLSSGINVVKAFDVLTELFAAQPILRDALVEAQANIVKGKSMSMALTQVGVFPSLVTEMAATGEESGRLTELLTACNRYYVKKMDQFLRRFSAVIDPILVIAVGGVVIVIVMAIMLPIMSLTKVH
jgi:type IV pilus assembly protein PilC